MTNIEDNVFKVENQDSYITGDPRCNECGGTEFIWTGTCKTCGDFYRNKWEALKDDIQKSIYNLSISLFSLDIKSTGISTFSAVLDVMKEMEEK